MEDETTVLVSTLDESVDAELSFLKANNCAFRSSFSSLSLRCSLCQRASSIFKSLRSLTRPSVPGCRSAAACVAFVLELFTSDDAEGFRAGFKFRDGTPGAGIETTERVLVAEPGTESVELGVSVEPGNETVERGVPVEPEAKTFECSDADEGTWPDSSVGGGCGGGETGCRLGYLTCESGADDDVDEEVIEGGCTCGSVVSMGYA